jgi:hypothetical protein
MSMKKNNRNGLAHVILQGFIVCGLNWASCAGSCYNCSDFFSMHGLIKSMETEQERAAQGNMVTWTHQRAEK